MNHFYIYSAVFIYTFKTYTSNFSSKKSFYDSIVIKA